MCPFELPYSRTVKRGPGVFSAVRDRTRRKYQKQQMLEFSAMRN